MRVGRTLSVVTAQQIRDWGWKGRWGMIQERAASHKMGEENIMFSNEQFSIGQCFVHFFWFLPPKKIYKNPPMFFFISYIVYVFFFKGLMRTHGGCRKSDYPLTLPLGFLFWFSILACSLLPFLLSHTPTHPLTYLPFSVPSRQPLSPLTHLFHFPISFLFSFSPFCSSP